MYKKINKKITITITITIILFVLVLVLLENKKRDEYVKINEEDPAINTIILYSSGVQKKPNEILSFRLIGNNGKLLHSADVNRNNLGYLSNNDYVIEKKKNEFRILVLGGEQTASSLSDKSWPDYLKLELEKNNNNPISVINIAWPDAGPEHYIKQWTEEGEKFKPDLVIVNYVETDFYRGLKGGPVKFKGESIEYKELAISVLEPPNNIVKLGLPKVKGSDPLSLADPNAIPARPYGFHVNREFMDSNEKIKYLQKKVVDEMIIGGMPCYGCMLWKDLTGTKLESIGTIRNFDAPQNQEKIKEEALVDYGVKKFGWLIDNISNVIIIHNFHYGEINQEYTLTNKMKTINSKISILDMREKIPKDAGDETIKSWYLIPFMGEKWSDKGHRAYAKMVSEVVMDWKNSVNESVGQMAIQSKNK